MMLLPQVDKCENYKKYTYIRTRQNAKVLGEKLFHLFLFDTKKNKVYIDGTVNFNRCMSRLEYVGCCSEIDIHSILNFPFSLLINSFQTRICPGVSLASWETIP